MSGTIGEVVVANTNPLYHLNATDNPGALISSVVLKEDNYPEWATMMTNSLQVKKKLGFIEGTINKSETEPDLSSSLAVKSLIIGWIRTAIDPKIPSIVAYVSYAATPWEKLRVCFYVGNGVRKQVLKDEIALCKQNGQLVLEYYRHLTKLLEELQNYNTVKVYRCEAAADIWKEREDDQVHKFMFGLDLPRFSNIRSKIMGEDPLPPLNQVYSRLIREEQNQNSAQSRDLKFSSMITPNLLNSSFFIDQMKFPDSKAISCI